jgi:hypothetical protein
MWLHPDYGKHPEKEERARKFISASLLVRWTGINRRGRSSLYCVPSSFTSVPGTLP